MSFLLCFIENHYEKSVRLPDHAILVGRSSSCDLTLSDPAISRRHCRLTPVGATVFLEDLDSANGTFVEGARIHQVELKTGAHLALGAYHVRLVAEPGRGFVCGGIDCPNRNGHLFQRGRGRNAKGRYLEVLLLDSSSGLYYCEMCFLDAGNQPQSGFSENTATTQVPQSLG